MVRKWCWRRRSRLAKAQVSNRLAPVAFARRAASLTVGASNTERPTFVRMRVAGGAADGVMFEVTHIVRVEDFPVMPVEVTGGGMNGVGWRHATAVTSAQCAAQLQQPQVLECVEHSAVWQFVRWHACRCQAYLIHCKL